MPQNLNVSSSIPQAAPACPSCGRACEPGASWKGANYCRAAVLLAYIRETPGLTTWQLSQAVGMAYPDASRGLQKAREHGLVATESEEREAGGIRYLYYPANDSVALDRFINTLHLVEARQ